MWFALSVVFTTENQVPGHTECNNANKDMVNICLWVEKLKLNEMSAAVINTGSAQLPILASVLKNKKKKESEKRPQVCIL